MDLESIKVIAETMAALVTPVAGILLSLYSWRKTGEIDLNKTLEHAKDVIALVTKLIKEGAKEADALKAGVKEIERIRGHKLSKKMARKAEARILALIKGLPFMGD